MELRPPLAHQSNQLYNVWHDHRHLILKEYVKSDERHEAVDRERRALELVRPLGIGPELVAWQAEPPAILYDFVPGQMWDRTPPSEAQLGQLAAIWLRLHTVAHAGLWPSHSQATSWPEAEAFALSRVALYADWVEAFPAGHDALRLTREALKRHSDAITQLGALPVSMCFCRSDPRFANVITCPDGSLRLVDWEDSGLRDPAREVADLLLHPNNEDLLKPAHWQAFLRPYLAGQPTHDPEVGARVHWYMLVFPVWWLAEFLAWGVRRAGSGQLDGWTINDMPANQRLRRYLARALAWPAEDFSAVLANLAGVTFF